MSPLCLDQETLLGEDPKEAPIEKVSLGRASLAKGIFAFTSLIAGEAQPGVTSLTIKKPRYITCAKKQCISSTC